MSNFLFYTVDTRYCDYLRKFDLKVPYAMNEKSNRPFIGIVFEINGFQYFAPLTSPKIKHLRMKNQIDFMKIKEGKWGAINLNNMIPVPPDYLNKIEMRIFENDTKSEKDYKNLLSNQLSWCNSHKNMILSRARKLYYTISQGKARKDLANRCCDFILDEKLYKKFIVIT